MILVILALILGFLFGWFYRKLELYKRILSNLYLFTVSVLLFSIGVTVGTNQDLLANLFSIGLKALLFTTIMLLSTLLVTYFVIYLKALPNK